MEIRKIAYGNWELEQCIHLWRENSATLGFFPRGAFEEHARQGRILGALTSSGRVAGYLLYRVTQRGSILPRVIIVHLCVNSEFRGKGLARSLVDYLVETGSGMYLRIELKCRRDFDSNQIWPNLGFHRIGEAEGRAGKPLVKWSIPLVHLPLFEVGSPADEQELYRLVIDANVFFRLEEPVPDGPDQSVRMSIEAKALVADWVPDSLGIYITDELHNEIERNNDQAQRDAMHCATRRYKKLTTNIQEMRSIEAALLEYFSENPPESTRSDVRQLAHAIAGESHFFITQDTALLKKTDEVQEVFTISIVAPGEFVALLDEALRDVDFRPTRLAGVRELQISKASVNEISGLYSSFRCNEMGEKKKAFNQLLRRYLAEPDQYSLRLASSSIKKEHLLLMAVEKAADLLQRIPLIRISKHPLARTVSRHTLLALVLQRAREGVSIISFENLCPNPVLIEAMNEIGFRVGDGFATRISLDFFGTLDGLISELENIMLATPIVQAALEEIIRMAREASRSADLLELAELERLLWPMKLKDATIPTYLVPIRPNWSMHLFDEELASQTLWGAREKIALNVENVYYRSAKPGSFIKAPARILWYVTDAFGYSGVKEIRACSRLDEVHIAPANNLFKRFSRLGIYTWEDVLRTAGGDPNKEIMAMRFSYTELLPQPIPLMRFEAILMDIEGKSPMLQGPSKIEPMTFEALYNYSTGRNEGHA